MSYRYPYGNTEQMNLDWFLNQWEKFKADWAEAEAGIDGSLDAEIAKVEAAMTELYAARDAAAASASAARQSSLDAVAAQVAAGNSKTAAQAAETSARGSQQAAEQSAQEAQASAQGAENSALTASQAANTATQQAAGADAARGAAEAAQQAAEGAQAAAAQSAGQAGQAATAAADHADNAADSATLAQQAAQDMSDSVEQITTNKNDISDLKESISEIAVEEKSPNLLNPNIAVMDGYYVRPNDGALIEQSGGFTLLDYIEVEGGKYLIVSRDGFYRSARFIAEYDANKTIIAAPSQSVEGMGNGNHYNSAYVLLNANTKYVRISFQNNTYPLAELMVSCSNNETLPTFEPYFKPHLSATNNFIKKYIRQTVDIYAEEGIASFFNKMKNAYYAKNCDVYVHKGLYTFTNELIEAIFSEYRGVPIGNGCHYYFETGAYLVCDYTGDNTSVKSFFSPLDSLERASDWEIYNLHLVAKNVLYALHDEANGQSAFCKHFYSNCYIELDNTALGSNGSTLSKSIGGGLGQYEEIIIQDCVFKTINPSKATVQEQEVTYHSANNSNFTDAKITVTGCYFVNGQFRTSDLYEDMIAPFPTVIYNNNSAVYAPLFHSTHTVYQWNNVLHE